MAKSKSESKTDSSTSNTTTYTDNRISAGNGGFVATGGSSINAYIESVDAQVAAGAVTAAQLAIAGNSDITKSALAGNAAVSANAIGGMANVANNAIGANSAVSQYAMGTTAGIADAANARNTLLALDAIDAGASLAGDTMRTFSAAQKDILAFTDTAIARGQDMFAAAAAGESSQLTKTIGDTMRTALIIAGIAAAAVGIAYVLKRAKPA